MLSYRSEPAVSHTPSVILRLPTATSRAPNAAPTVGTWPSVHRPCKNRCTRQVLPTSDMPSNTTFKSTFFPCAMPFLVAVSFSESLFFRRASFAAGGAGGRVASSGKRKRGEKREKEGKRKGGGGGGRR